jgi:hypothetical protein
MPAPSADPRLPKTRFDELKPAYQELAAGIS